MDAKIQIIKEISKLFLNLNKEITYRKKVKGEKRRVKTKNEEWRVKSEKRRVENGEDRGYKKTKTFENHFPKVSAVRTRLELVTSCVTGRHSNQLN